MTGVYVLDIEKGISFQQIKKDISTKALKNDAGIHEWEESVLFTGLSPRSLDQVRAVAGACGTKCISIRLIHLALVKPMPIQ